jgi:outer membrane immunogenic protein
MMIPRWRLRHLLLGTISMRRLVLSAVLALSALPAFAADMAGPPPVLRGALPASGGIDWSGFYLGGTASYNSTSLDRSGNVGASSALLQRLVGPYVIAPYVLGTPLVESGLYGTTSTGFGAFGGYNWTADEIVFGVEADYTRGAIKNEVRGSRSARTPDIGGQTYNWTVNTHTRSKITEFGTIRGRLGYAYGNLLPFMTAGLALGRASETSSASISSFEYTTALGVCGVPPAQPCIPNVYTPATMTEGNRAKLKTGYTVGAGFDYAFSSNIFVRAEYQHVRFSDVANSTAQINQAKVGAGVKF